ncbi:hypothetical protein PS870_01162 [Pseudomonas fluorescens]|uniref:Uncharacterized protein n=1 Tax=Pseudomonas fluorescens TaxID=294 RepID=A0A5E7HYN9_PSEFL|nr:hypothetical protein PS870_01162 [Pseudomonas fluorescens]
MAWRNSYIASGFFAARTIFLPHLKYLIYKEQKLIPNKANELSFMTVPFESSRR